MNIVEQSVELWDIPNTSTTMLRHIERAGRVCYKSEDKITYDSAEHFVRRIIERGHESVLEHGNIILQCNRRMYKAFHKHCKNENGHGHSIYLRFTNTSLNRDGTDRYIVSGNIRAFRDFIHRIYYDHSTFYDWMESLKRLYPWAFFDLDYEDARCHRQYDYSCSAVIINESDLKTDDEILTHMCVTQKATVDRGITHELVRHRPASYSQESTRYCNYATGKFGSEISVIKPDALSPESELAWTKGCREAERAYNRLIEQGVKPQIARSVLPTCLKAELVVTANLRELLHMINLRGDNGAHPQAIQWAQMTLAQLRAAFPNIRIDAYKDWVKNGY